MDKLTPEKENANSGEAVGAGVGGGGEAKATKQKRKIHCSVDATTKFTAEIRAAGLALRSSDGDTQLATLVRLLQYLGSRGANTYELVAAGYLRPSARISDLQDVWVITSSREDCVGPDDLWHKGIARYYLVGKRKDLPPAQRELGLEVPA